MCEEDMPIYIQMIRVSEMATFVTQKPLVLILAITAIPHTDIPHTDIRKSMESIKELS